MFEQVTRQNFEQALLELGQDPAHYKGKRLNLKGFCELYEQSEEAALDAIEIGLMEAHYDYKNDCIWVDALDAAHYYYCHCGNQKP